MDTTTPRLRRSVTLTQAQRQYEALEALRDLADPSSIEYAEIGLDLGELEIDGTATWGRGWMTKDGVPW